jgi:hypothetical protein
MPDLPMSLEQYVELSKIIDHTLSVFSDGSLYRSISDSSYCQRFNLHSLFCLEERLDRAISSSEARSSSSRSALTADASAMAAYPIFDGSGHTYPECAPKDSRALITREIWQFPQYSHVVRH